MEEVGRGLELWVRRLVARSDLQQADLDVLRSLPGKLEQVPRGRDFVRVGRQSTTVDLIVSGLAGRYGQDAEGTSQLVAVHLPGEAANLRDVVLPTSYCSETAVQDTVLIRIPVEAMHQALQASPRVALAFWRDSAAQAAIVDRWLLRNGLMPAPKRLAHFLCEFAMRSGVADQTAVEYRLGLTQTQVGEALGLTSVHVNRTIRFLRSEGLLEWHHAIVKICNWQEMKVFAEFDHRYLYLNAGQVAAGLDVSPPYMSREHG